MTAVLTWCAIGLAAATAVSVCVLAARRVLVARAERRHVDSEARLRPIAVALLEGDEVAVGELPEQETEVLAALLGRLGRSLRGVSRERIAAFFEERGSVERELRVLRSRRAWRRATAAFALGDMGAPRAVPALLSCLDDANRGVRAAATRSLGRLGAETAVEPIVYALASDLVPRSVAGQALLAIGPAVLPALRALQTAPEAEARAFAVELVGLLGDASDGGRLVERLRDSSAEVRAAAARSLGRLGAEEGAAELRRALDDRIPFVRVQAANALGAVGDPDVVPDLVRVAREDAFEPAHAAARAAARLSPERLRHAASRPGAGPHLHEAADIVEARR